MTDHLTDALIRLKSALDVCPEGDGRRVLFKLWQRANGAFEVPHTSYLVLADVIAQCQHA